MRGLQKSKRVSWAPDVNLCQVRLFLSEDSPSQVGLGAQDHLQAKTSWLLHSTGMGSDDHLPPGFEGAHPANQLKKELSQIPLIKWKCPPKFVLTPSWQVVAGEESKEVEIQNQREMRVLEAVYPRPSAIPSSPSVSLEVEDYRHDDSHALIIPVTPIEDDDATDPSCNLVAPSNPMGSLPLVVPQGLLPSGTPPQSQYDLHSAPKAPTSKKLAFGAVPGVEPDVVAAASAAFTAIMRSNEPGSLIDRDLLIKILGNPKLIEKLVADHGNTTNSQTTPKPKSPPMTPLVPQSILPPAHINRTESDAPFSAAPTTGPFFPATNAVVPSLNPRPPPPEIGPTVKVPPVKDINYYKSLIQQHGGERQETQDRIFTQFSNRPNQQMIETNTEPVQSSKPRDSKPKIMKPCIYFNSSRGCRNGANCAYQHDGSCQRRSGSMQEAQSAKRMRLDREITGRT
ncbi:zinc finger CCCH domain-containing protein 6-like [Macadamia integrifolia]|uniref:zinc finger CCCH domain-containing protein 6-like n=1 Tax=Macadamia integrifolia TaxID=60698 RepID=UPI001C4F3A95|nr:zinc finger CCCH domain-containing protein 6-like [Macadamia integrifolia]